MLADALTSVCAIVALVAGRFFGLRWMDPAMGVLGSLLVARWSWSLLRQTGNVLLDHQAPDTVRETIRVSIEDDGPDRVSDLHVWSIGPGLWAAEIAVVTDDPRPAEAYRARIPPGLGLAHVTIETCPCPHDEPG